MKRVTSILVTALTLAISSPLFAEDVGHGFDVSANAAFGTDYVWRGDTQTGGNPAMSGGLDLVHSPTGLYIGTWGSNVLPEYGGLELDVYGGVSNEMFDSGVSYDFGTIGYLYPGTAANDDVYEVYAGLGATFGRFSPSAKVYHNYSNIDLGYDEYYEGTLDVDLDVVTVSGRYGYKNQVSVSDWGVGASVNVLKLDWGLNYYGSDTDSNRVVFSVGKAF